MAQSKTGVPTDWCPPLLRSLRSLRGQLRERVDSPTVSWYDLHPRWTDDPIGVVEIDASDAPLGTALELQIFVTEEVTLGAWVLENGQLLSWVTSVSA